MMAHRWSQGQMDACAVFHGIGRRDELISAADILSRLNDGQFEAAMNALRTYRKSVIDQPRAMSGKPVRRSRLRAV
jgi:hypothetical protein